MYHKNFESKHYSFTALQNMLYQELKNQIYNDVKSTNCLEKRHGRLTMFNTTSTLFHVSDYRNFWNNARWKPYEK